MRWQLLPICIQPAQSNCFADIHLNVNNIPLIISRVFQPIAAVKLILDQLIPMGLLLDPDEFLAHKDISKVRLSEIERLVIPKPIPCIAMLTMTPEQQHALIDQILAANLQTLRLKLT